MHITFKLNKILDFICCESIQAPFRIDSQRVAPEFWEFWSLWIDSRSAWIISFVNFSSRNTILVRTLQLSYLHSLFLQDNPNATNNRNHTGIYPLDHVSKHSTWSIPFQTPKSHMHHSFNTSITPNNQKQGLECRNN